MFKLVLILEAYEYKNALNHQCISIVSVLIVIHWLQSQLSVNIGYSMLKYRSFPTETPVFGLQSGFAYEIHFKICL